MRLPRNDFRSIWEIAHVWEGFNPEQTDPENPPEPVADKLQKLIWGYLNAQLSLRYTRGWRVLPDSMFLFFFNLNRTRVHLGEIAVGEKPYDKVFLSGLFVRRGQFLRWCEKEYLTPPKIWAPAVSPADSMGRPAVGKHHNEANDKQSCQAIARTLWDIDARIHPAHMAKSKAVLQYGNGAHYKGENTVKGWVGEVDPLRKERKPGRPPVDASEYLIHLETGALRQDVTE